MSGRLSIVLAVAMATAGASAGEPPKASGQVAVHQGGGPAGLPAAGGDLVLANDLVAAVVKQDGSGVELYAKGAGGWTRRAQLAPVVGKETAKLTGARTVSNDAGTAAVEAKAGNATVVLTLNTGEPVLKVTPTGKVDGLRIAAPCRLAVLPDFFADDLLIDARDIPVARAEIPGGNMLLCMVGNGGAIVAALRDKNEQDMEMSLSGDGGDRAISSSDVPFGTGGSVWTAVLEQSGVWYSREFAAGEVAKGVRLEDWTIPFLANWKGDFMREDGNSESMQFSLSPSLYDRMSTVARGGIDRKGGKLTAVVSDSQRDMVEFGAENPKGTKAYAAKYVGLKGIGVIYPITRTDDTPLDRLCLADLMRMSLGTGPCESILDLDARQPKSKGIFTCSYGGMWQRLIPPDSPFQEDDVIRRMKEQRYFFRRYNRNVMTFVKNVQDRINTYVEFGLQMTAYLDEQEKKHPELAEFIGRLKAEWAKPVWQYGEPYPNTEKSVNEKISAAHVREFDKATRIDTPEQAAKARAATALPQEVGDPGDRRMANIRRKVMLIRAMAAMEVARNPVAGEVAGKVRAMAEEALRNPHRYEQVTVW